MFFLKDENFKNVGRQTDSAALGSDSKEHEM